MKMRQNRAFGLIFANNLKVIKSLRYNLSIGWTSRLSLKL